MSEFGVKSSQRTNLLKKIATIAVVAVAMTVVFASVQNKFPGAQKRVQIASRIAAVGDLSVAKCEDLCAADSLKSGEPQAVMECKADCEAHARNSKTRRQCRKGCDDLCLKHTTNARLCAKDCRLACKDSGLPPVARDTTSNQCSAEQTERVSQEFFGALRKLTAKPGENNDLVTKAKSLASQDIVITDLSDNGAFNTGGTYKGHAGLEDYVRKSKYEACSLKPGKEAFQHLGRGDAGIVSARDTLTCDNGAVQHYATQMGVSTAVQGDSCVVDKITVSKFLAQSAGFSRNVWTKSDGISGSRGVEECLRDLQEKAETMKVSEVARNFVSADTEIHYTAEDGSARSTSGLQNLGFLTGLRTLHKNFENNGISATADKNENFVLFDNAMNAIEIGRDDCAVKKVFLASNNEVHPSLSGVVELKKSPAVNMFDF